jgi:hypothetical protein
MSDTCPMNPGRNHLPVSEYDGVSSEPTGYHCAMCGEPCEPSDCGDQARETPEPLTDYDRGYANGYQQGLAGVRAATPDPAEPGLREAVAAHVACVCEQLTGEGPRPLGNGRVYHFQGCCADSDLALRAATPDRPCTDDCRATCCAEHPHWTHWHLSDDRAATPDPAEPPIVAGIARCPHGAPLHACCTPDPAEPGLRETAQAVVDKAEPDDSWEGEYVDYLVPAETLDRLLAALSDTTEGQS